MNIIRPLTLVTLATFAASVIAQERPPFPKQDQAGDWLRASLMLQREGSAMIPRAALAIGAQRRFAQIDANADGQLSLAELGAWRWMRTMDSDFDGSVSKAEIDRYLQHLEKAVQLPNADPKRKPPFFSADENALQRGPSVIASGPAGVGSIVAPDIEVQRVGGEPLQLRALLGEKASVLVALSTSCPVGKRYVPALRRLEADYAAKGVRFIFVAASDADSDAELAACGFSGPLVREKSGALFRALGARSTADAFVLDAKRTLAYRGAIDDQYGVGYSIDAPKSRYLADAIDAVLAGTRPEIEATDAAACELELPPVAQSPHAPVTYHNRISRILAANCTECHRAGGLGPFPLETLEQVRAKAKTLARVLKDGVMPPWFAVCEPPDKPSPWINDRSLRADDRADLLAWLASDDRPEGNAADAPVPRPAQPEWALGKPDLVLQIPKPIDIPAEGTMPWQNIVIDPGVTEDKWAVAMEVQPTARAVVHHVLIFVRTPQGPGLPSVAGFSGDEMEGFFAAYVPGAIPAIYPDGFGKILPAGSKLRFQIHYTPNGTATTDQTRLGIKFCPPPRHEIETMPIANPLFQIPPGDPNFTLTAYIPILANIRVLSLTPHMHLRGKAFRFEVALPDGRERTMVEVPRYDFNWQVPAAYANPPLLPAGSKIRTVAWFDNSAENRVNPNPAATVRWGEKTSDEMMLGYLEYYRDRPDAEPARTVGR